MVGVIVANCSFLIRCLDLKCLRNTLRRFVMGIQKVDVSKEEPSSINEVMPEHITAVCTAVSLLMPVKDDPYFWETVQSELLAALLAIQKAEHTLSQCGGNLLNVNFTLLETMYTAKVHLGLAMALVLCPPLVDPLTISATEYQFLCGIVSSTWFFVVAVLLY